jgi:hypothetical protein
MTNDATRFLAALLFTVVTETLALVFTLRYLFKVRNVGAVQIAYAGLAANVSSLPYLWFVLPLFCRRYFVYAAVGEVGVFLWEAVFYHMFFRFPLKKAMVLSLAANLTSFLLGLPIFGP